MTMLSSGQLFMALLAITVVSVTGSPVEFEKRELGVIYMCQGKNWGQPCYPFHLPGGGCQNVPDDYDNKINSIGTADSIVCLTYA